MALCPIIDLTAFYCPLCGSYTLSSESAACGVHQLPDGHYDRANVMRAKLIEAIEKLGYFMISLPVEDSSVAVGSVLSRARDIHHEVRRISHEFFKQPTEKKMEAVSIDRARRGYSQMATENFASLVGDGTKPNDSVEKFRIGPMAGDANVTGDAMKKEQISEDSSLQEYYNAKPARVHFFPNDWRNVSSSFHEVSKSYYETMYDLAMIILTVIESCCQLMPGSLTHEFDREKHTSILCYNYYPPLPLPSPSHGKPSPALIERIAEHTDVSMFTIVTDLDRETLHENDVSLEIFNALQSCWEPVEYSRGMYLINIGDCLSERSGSKLKSALHRVVMRRNPSEHYELKESTDIVLSRERFSSAFFFAPNYNAKMTWIEEQDGKEDITAEAVDYDTWRKQRVKRAMDMLKKGQLPSFKSNGLGTTSDKPSKSIKKLQKKIEKPTAKPVEHAENKEVRES